MMLAAYSMAVAVVYALLYTASPDDAQRLVVAFAIAILLPALAHERKRR